MVIAACLGFVACAGGVQKQNTWNPYEIHPAAQVPSGVSVPVDNDSYYSRPGGYSCTMINDAPSCGGG